MSDTRQLEIPNYNLTIVEGYRVKLGRFDTTVWEVSHGWYSWGGNRPVCGWFLTDVDAPTRVKPLQLTDLDDIYFIET